MRPFVLAILTVAQLACGAAASDHAVPEKGREIFEGARRAAGADKAELRDYAYAMTTELTVQGRPVRMDSRVKVMRPGFFRQEVTSGGQDLVMIVNEDGGRRVQAGVRRPMPDAAVARLRADLDRAHVLFSDPPPETVRFRGREELDGREVDVIEISSVADTPLRLFIDPESHRVLKTMHVGDVPGGGMAQIETEFSNYVEAGGVWIPLERRVIRNGQEATRSVIRDLEVNSGLTADDFVD